MSAARCRLLVVDDHPLVAAALVHLLEGEPGFELAGHALGADTGYRLYRELAPDVVVLDLSLPDMGGLELLRRLRASDADASVLVLSVHDSPAYVERARRLGARGYLDKRAAGRTLLRALRAVAAGGEWFPAGQQRRDSGVSTLTPRELEVLRQLASGRSVEAIARLLRASPKTIGVHRARLARKLGTGNLAHLTHIAIAAGLVPPPAP